MASDGLQLREVNASQEEPHVVMLPTDMQVSANSSHEAKRWVLARAIIGEFLCTFIFMYADDPGGPRLTPNRFTVMATALNVSGTDSALIAPVVTAFIAVGVIYSFADVSGAHFNPAVTIATMATGKTSATKGACYIGAQLIGSLFATMFLGLVYSKDTLGVMARKLVVMPPTDVRKMDAVFSEFFSTYIFIFVIFSVVFDTLDTKHVDVLEKASNENIGVRKVQARNMTIYTTSGQDKAGFAPIAIGLTLGAMCLLSSSVSGGVFNPARVFGPALVGWKWTDQWVYWIGDLLGAVAAGWSQRALAWLKHQAVTAL